MQTAESHNMLRSAWRAVARDPGFSAAAVLTLALGIGANTAMFSVIDGVLLKPLAYREPDRLILAFFGPAWRLADLISPEIYNLWRDRATTLEKVAIVGPGVINLTGTGQAEQLVSARVSSSLFSTLGTQPLVGRAFRENEDLYQGPHTAILSDGLWHRRFGADPAVVGRKILLDGERYEVIGVMTPGFELPVDSADFASGFDILLPVGIGPDQMRRHAYFCVARLKPGVTMEQASAELDTTLASVRGRGDWGDVVLKTFTFHLRPHLTKDVRGGLRVLMAAVGLVLLITCANLANLLLNRGLTRRKEIAVRAALGAGRGQILRQLLAESLGLSLLGGAAGVLAAAWMLAAILAQVPTASLPMVDKPVPILPHTGAIAVDARALFFCLAATILCALLFATLPAWRFSKAEPQEALGRSQRGTTQTRGSDSLRRWLIAGQVALCTMLLIGAGLLLRSFGKILRLDRGFETNGVLTAAVPLEGFRLEDDAWGLIMHRADQATEQAAHRDATYRAIEERIAAIPGVDAAGAVSWLPLSWDANKIPIYLPEVSPEADMRNVPSADLRFATPGYFRAAGIRLHAGRLYSGADTWTAVVSASAALRLWPGRNPIGQEFNITEAENHPHAWRVAGVVADVSQYSLESRPPLMIYLPPAHNLGLNLWFVLRTKLPADSVAPAIRRAVAQVNPNVPVTAIRPMSDLVAASTAPRRFHIILLSSFAAVAMLLAAVGIYGTLSYSVNQRYREIGIRMALGAQSRDVRTLVLRQALAPVVLGLLAGCVGALMLMRALSSLLYGVGSGDVATYAASGALVMVVAIASSWAPARRAMRLDPVDTIRCE